MVLLFLDIEVIFVIFHVVVELDVRFELGGNFVLWKNGLLRARWFACVAVDALSRMNIQLVWKHLFVVSFVAIDAGNGTDSCASSVYAITAKPRHDVGHWGSPDELPNLI